MGPNHLPLRNCHTISCGLFWILSDSRLPCQMYYSDAMNQNPDWVVAGAAVGQFLAAVVSAFNTVKILKANRDAVEAMRKATELTKTIFERSSRPYIIVQSVLPMGNRNDDQFIRVE